jgi:hypothetical protein
VANQIQGYVANFLARTMAAIQTTTLSQYFGHALALVMPKYWWG